MVSTDHSDDARSTANPTNEAATVTSAIGPTRPAGAASVHLQLS